MSNKRQETIEDILRDMHYCAEKNSAWCCTTVEFETFADRIEAAAKREREAGAEVAQICGEICEMVGREEVKNHSVTNCNRLGNAAKMREALENIAEYAKAAACHTEDAHLLGYLNQIAMFAEDALSAPPRNCDVGTPEEQSKRHREWCRQARCVFGCIRCMAEWLQLPYVRELQTTGEVVK